MPRQLTADEQIYLNALRTGDQNKSEIVLRSGLTQTHKDDFAYFRSFLADNGKADPQPRDLALHVPKQTVLQLLSYFESRNCLGVQTCFGFNKPIDEGGQIQLLNKGNFYAGVPVLSDSEIWANIYKTDQHGFILPEMYSNLDREQPIRVTTARRYLKQFRTYYPGRTIRHNPFIHGITLPIKALLQLFTSNQSFGQTETLTFQWGMTVYYPGERTMGNMTLMIGCDDFANGSVIEIRTEEIGEPAQGDCPPKLPCSL